MKSITIILLIFSGFFVACYTKNDKTSVGEQSHHASMNQPFEKPKVTIKKIGILLYDGFTALDAIGPYEVLHGLEGADVFFVAKEKGLVGNEGMKIAVNKSFTDVYSLDILIIPGGFQETYLTQFDTVTLNWIRKIDKTTVYTASVCTGAWILGAAGLLIDKNATTHWYGKKILSEEFGAKIQDKRWVQDGKYWTSAGVTAGMDMCLAMVNEIMGEQYTKTVMLNLEYDPQPPFQAGSEKNTEKEIVDMMRAMYDAGINGIKEEAHMHPKPTSHKRHQKTPADPVVFANTVDFICDMKVMPSYTDTCHYKNRVYAFCSAYCRDKFKETPEKYLSTQ